MRARTRMWARFKAGRLSTLADGGAAIGQAAPHVSVAGLTVRYGGNGPRWRRLDLGIGQGRVVRAAGRVRARGRRRCCGRLAGFIAPVAGRITLGGQDITALAAASPAGEHDVPILCAVSAYERGGQYWVRPAAAGAGLSAEIERRVRRVAGAGAAGGVCRAASGRAVRRAAATRGSGTQPGAAAGRCCCWTNRSRHWTAGCARRPGRSWCGCSGSLAPPSCWSRMTRRRRCPWRPGSGCWSRAGWRRWARRRRSTSAR